MMTTTTTKATTTDELHFHQYFILIILPMYQIGKLLCVCLSLWVCMLSVRCSFGSDPFFLFLFTTSVAYQRDKKREPVSCLLISKDIWTDTSDFIYWIFALNGNRYLQENGMKWNVFVLFRFLLLLQGSVFESGIQRIFPAWREKSVRRKTQIKIEF